MVYASTLGVSEDRENERACFVAFKGTVPLARLFPSTDTETLKTPEVFEIGAALDICWKVTGASIKIAIS